jgi:hypothetical protein
MPEEAITVLKLTALPRPGTILAPWPAAASGMLWVGKQVGALDAVCGLASSF